MQNPPTDVEDSAPGRVGEGLSLPEVSVSVSMTIMCCSRTARGFL